MGSPFNLKKCSVTTRYPQVSWCFACFKCVNLVDPSKWYNREQITIRHCSTTVHLAPMGPWAHHSPWPSQPWPETKALWFGGHSHLLQGNVEVLWWRYRLVMALWAQLISTPRSRVAVSGDPLHVLVMIATLVCNPHAPDVRWGRFQAREV